MPQQSVWEKEYKNPKLITGYDRPQSFVLRFLKYLKKEEKVKIEDFKTLDLGSGTGRNSNYLAERGAEVVGMEISNTAIKIAKKRAKEQNLSVDYLNHSIGETYPFEDENFDLVLDITSSNSLNELERGIYLKEVFRVLKKDGYFLVRLLAKDGDKNALRLLKNFPDKEHDTYIIPGLGLVERVFSKSDFINLYSKYFKIIKMEKDTTYTKFEGQSYKRNFWIVYLKK